MAIITPNINTNVDKFDYTNQDEARLADLIKATASNDTGVGAQAVAQKRQAATDAQKQQQEALLKQMLQKGQLEGEATNKAAEINAKRESDSQARDEAVSTAQKLQEMLTKQHPGSKYTTSVSPQGVSISEGEANPFMAARQQDHQAEGLSKRYEKYTGFDSALRELEARTNADGKGGVLTNPDAKLVSTGTVMSSVPTQALGLGELLGVPGVPKGASDERKLLERVQLEYQKAMTGQRTSEPMAAKERQALGWMSSGDPSLVAKGVRALGENVKNAYNTIQGGYNPDIVNTVSQRMGGDPKEMYNQIPQDAPIGQPARPQGAAPAPQARPQQQQAPGAQQAPQSQDPDYLRYQQLLQKQQAGGQ